MLKIPARLALIPHVRKDGRNIVSYGVQSEMTINTPFWVQARDVKPNERGGFDFVATTNLASKTSALGQGFFAGAGSA